MAWRYRDNLTGRWVSEATYTRSVSHGGSSYRRESDADYGHDKSNIPYSLDDYYDTGFDTDEYDEAAGGADYGEAE